MTIACWNKMLDLNFVTTLTADVDTCCEEMSSRLWVLLKEKTVTKWI